jgi:hypothetical protein
LALKNYLKAEHMLGKFMITDEMSTNDGKKFSSSFANINLDYQIGDDLDVVAGTLYRDMKRNLAPVIDRINVGAAPDQPSNIIINFGMLGQNFMTGNNLFVICRFLCRFSP